MFVEELQSGLIVPKKKEENKPRKPFSIKYEGEQAKEISKHLQQIWDIISMSKRGIVLSPREEDLYDIREELFNSFSRLMVGHVGYETLC